MDKNTKWIWFAPKSGKNEYAEFCADFKSNGEKTFIKISCDGIYSISINGKIAAFSACADYPDYKFYDEIDITEFCGEYNVVKITVWHFGADTQTYIKDAAGVIFEITVGGKIVAASSEKTLSRKMTEYKNGYGKIITSQLGFSFLYNNTAVKKDYSVSVEIDKNRDLHKRGIKPLVLGERLPFGMIKKENSVIIDMGKEVAGFIDLDFNSPIKQKILFAYGEHIEGGKVRRIIGDRDFSVEFIAKAGKNSYMNTLRRIAGRYIEVFSEKPVEIEYIGIRPVNYPVQEKTVKFGDALIQKIYDVSVNTLKLCMHEHYEDCPWREQALYTLDSRNQMLFGYYAFKDGNKDYVRHNLVLISKGLRKDGLLSLCFPSGIDIPIPFFSLAYIIQVYEYVKYIKDDGLLNEVGETVKKIIETFDKKTDDNGLIPSFPYPYWNFYEWAEESNNDWQIMRKKEDGHVKSYDLILNCAYVYALKLYDELFNDCHNPEKIKAAIKNCFYNGETYKLSTTTEKYSQLGNALAILIGLGDERLAEKIISDKKMIRATLSVRTFLYDTLLSFGDKYKGYILDDIKKNYKKMLDAGATSFWETEKGADDFDGAGSLCHGWSAVPILYFNLLNIK